MKATFSPPVPSPALVLLELTEKEAREFIAVHGPNGASTSPKNSMAIRLRIRRALVEALPEKTGCKCGKEGECCAKS